jgi:hypothetical protein
MIPLSNNVIDRSRPHNSCRARNSNRACRHRRYVRPEAGAHAHILALNNIYVTAMRPTKIPQVSAKSGCSRAGRRIFVDTSAGEGISSMEKLMGLGIGKKNGHQTFTIHEDSTGMQIVMHGCKCFARLQGEYQMIRPAMDACGWNPGVQIIDRVAEQFES